MPWGASLPLPSDKNIVVKKMFFESTIHRPVRGFQCVELIPVHVSDVHMFPHTWMLLYAVFFFITCTFWA